MPRPRSVDDATLLAAAGRAMGSHGPTELTLAVVAAEAGVSPATLVARFGSKHGLIRAVSEHAAARAAEVFASARASGHSPLTAIADAYAETVAEVAHADMGHHIAHLGQDASHPDLRAAAAEQARVMRAETAALLRDAGAHLRAGTDVERLARAVHLTFNGSLVAWALDGGDPGSPTAAQTVRDDIDFVLSAHTVEA